MTKEQDNLIQARKDSLALFISAAQAYPSILPKGLDAEGLVKELAKGSDLINQHLNGPKPKDPNARAFWER
jgi:hypothetical protein